MAITLSADQKTRLKPFLKKFLEYVRADRSRKDDADRQRCVRYFREELPVKLVSDDDQSKRVEREAEGLPEEFRRALAFWSVGEVQRVDEGLCVASESINRLGLAPGTIAIRQVLTGRVQECRGDPRRVSACVTGG